jgi:hypothetical protein
MYWSRPSPRGLCEDVLRTVLTEHELVIAENVLEELERLLAQKRRMSESKISDVIAFVRTQADVVNPSEPARWPERDPDDRWIWPLRSAPASISLLPVIAICSTSRMKC